MNDSQTEIGLKLMDIASKAPNRRKLFDLIQKVYDLPNYGPCITTEYLQEIKNTESLYLKVKRSATHTIPKGSKRNFTAFDIFNELERNLVLKGKKKTGFTHLAIPNMDWMLRMLIWLDPSRKDEIFAKQIRDKRMEGL